MLAARIVDDLKLRGRGLRAGVGVAQPPVPHIRVLRDQAAHSRARIEGPDQDRRPAPPRCGREESRRADPVVGALELGELGPEQALDDLKRLLKTPDPLLVRKTEREVLPLGIAGPQAEDEATVADVVDRDRHLRHEAGVAVPGAGDK